MRSKSYLDFGFWIRGTTGGAGGTGGGGIEVTEIDGVICDVTLMAVVGRDTNLAESRSKISFPMVTGSPCTEAWRRSISSSES